MWDTAAATTALSIRDVPPEVRDQLAARARERGQSLQAYLLELVTEDARRVRNAQIMARFAGRSDGANLDPDERQSWIDPDKAERDARADDRDRRLGAGECPYRRWQLR